MEKHVPRSSTPDLRKYTPAQLEALIDKANKRKHELTTKRVDRARTRIMAILRAEGLTVADVFGSRAGGDAPAKAKGRTKPGPKGGYTVKPKYRNPGNGDQTWSGRGKQPRWFADALAGGKSADDLLIR
jgi:DNA-binding protein H-NS